MYLKLSCDLDLPAIGVRLSPDASPDAFDHDSENVYEWMYLSIPGLAFSLNISREHGRADIEDELLSTASEEELRALVKPGPVYIFGLDRETDTNADKLPDWLPQYIADKLKADVLVYHRRINVDLPDGDPVVVVKPNAANSK